MRNRDFDNLKIKPIIAPEETVEIIRDIDARDLRYQKAKRYSQDTSYRGILTVWMMFVVSVWLVCVMIFVVFNKPWCLFISDKVLITLLATTTINVLGLANIVLKGMFYPFNIFSYSKNKKHKHKKNNH